LHRQDFNTSVQEKQKQFYSAGDQPFVEHGIILLKISRSFIIIPDFIFQGEFETSKILLREFAPFLVVRYKESNPTSPYTHTLPKISSYISYIPGIK
jgi:hypothetical protein